MVGEEERKDVVSFFFFFQAEDGIRDLVRSRGLGDVYKRQTWYRPLRTIKTAEQQRNESTMGMEPGQRENILHAGPIAQFCLLYTSDAADDLLCVDLGGRRIIKKKTTTTTTTTLASS